MTRSGKIKKLKVRKIQKKRATKGTPGKPPNIGVPWGRAASQFRPGRFCKRYLEEHGEACAADIFYGLKQELKRINKERVEVGEHPIRGCTYNSFAKYWHWFKKLKLVEPTGMSQAAIYDFLQDKRFYRLTAEGVVEEQAWENPVRFVHPEVR